MRLRRFGYYLFPTLLGTAGGSLVTEVFLLFVSLAVVVDYRLIELLRSLPEAILAGIVLTVAFALLLRDAKRRLVFTIAFASSVVGFLLGLMLLDLARTRPIPILSQWEPLPGTPEWFALYISLGYVLCTVAVGSILASIVALVAYIYERRPLERGRTIDR